MQLKPAVWLCFFSGLAANIGRLNPSRLHGDRGSLLYMATPLNIPKFDSSAGLIALSLAEAYQVSPHNILAERERVHVASLIAKSFGGLTEISAKAADAVAAFNGLQEFLNEGKLYFFEGSPAPSQDQIVSSIQPSEPHSPSSDQIFSVRRGLYALGRREGFDRLLKQTRKKLSTTVGLEGAVFPKQLVEEIILYCRRLEVQRVERLHKVSQALDIWMQTVSSDKHLQNTLCAISGQPDAERFTDGCRIKIRALTRELFTWKDSATTANLAFRTTFEFQGWIATLAKLKDTLPAAAHAPSPSAIKLSQALSPERKREFAGTVVEVLDDIAFLSRKHTTLVDSPIKDIFRMHFLVAELQKELPTDIAEVHKKTLETVTQRFLQHRDSPVYIIGIECDNLLPEHERTLLLRHLAQSQPPTPTAPPVSESMHIVQERRTKIRRELKESLELDRMKQQVQEVMGRIQELKASSPTQVPKSEAGTRFFPPRLEQEFHTWLSDFQDFVQSGAHDLLESAAKGERVDFKLIPIEKKMFELRLIGGSGIRIYCTRTKNSELVVLGFGTKTSQKQDILTAHERYRNLTTTA